MVSDATIKKILKELDEKADSYAEQAKSWEKRSKHMATLYDGMVQGVDVAINERQIYRLCT